LGGRAAGGAVAGAAGDSMAISAGGVAGAAMLLEAACVDRSLSAREGRGWDGVAGGDRGLEAASSPAGAAGGGDGHRRVFVSEMYVPADAMPHAAACATASLTAVADAGGARAGGGRRGLEEARGAAAAGVAGAPVVISAGAAAGAAMPLSIVWLVASMTAGADGRSAGVGSGDHGVEAATGAAGAAATHVCVRQSSNNLL
jgi:hypothetical protein